MVNQTAECEGVTEQLKADNQMEWIRRMNNIKNRAFEVVLSELYDAAILDIMMPVMDGVSVFVEVRKARNATPILLLTAKAEIDDKIIGLDAGANDYLTKPFDMRELLARLRVLTRKSDIQQTNTLTFGNTALNTETFELSAPGGSYKLANKEYQTMLLFMRNPRTIPFGHTFLIFAESWKRSKRILRSIPYGAQAIRWRCGNDSKLEASIAATVCPAVPCRAAHLAITDRRVQPMAQLPADHPQSRSDDHDDHFRSRFLRGGGRPVFHSNL